MRRFLSKFVRQILKRLSKSMTMDGVWVAADDVATLSKVQDAMGFIKTHDPRRYARLVTDLKGVWVTLLTGPLGQFFYDDYVCEIDGRFVAGASLAEIASVIVHEAAHARLWRRGIRYAEDIRSRVETICVRQQQAFQSKLLAQDARVDEFAYYLNLPGATWSDEALHRKQLRGSVDLLRHLKVPDWLILVVVRRHRSRTWRQRRAKT